MVWFLSYRPSTYYISISPWAESSCPDLENQASSPTHAAKCGTKL
jgi:hypothetical protein